MFYELRLPNHEPKIAAIALKHFVRDIIPEDSPYRDKIFHHIQDEDMYSENIFAVPELYYGKPSLRDYRLYGFDDDLLKYLGGLLVQHKIAKKFYLNELDFIPRMTNSKVRYHTRTPIVVFTHSYRKVFDTIMHKYQPGEERDREFQSAACDFIRRNIKYQLQARISRDKKYAFVDEIDIEWRSFKVIMVQGRNNHKKVPAIVGEFSSNYVLPLFLGRESGIGFGECRRIDERTWKKVFS